MSGAGFGVPRENEDASARADLDLRRRRARYRAWHRGTREMDLIMGPFADAALPGMDESHLDTFEALIQAPDGDLYRWIAGDERAPGEYETPLLDRLRAFHAGPARD